MVTEGNSSTVKTGALGESKKSLMLSKYLIRSDRGVSKATLTVCPPPTPFSD